jgi:probable HAF family extracellular repeat protein
MLACWSGFVWHLISWSFLLLIGLALFAFGRLTLAEGPPRFVPIGTSDATGISADGTTVTGRYYTPYLWRESTGIQSIPLPTGYELFSVNDISGDGTTIVGGGANGTGTNRHYESFRWRQDTGFQLLGRLPTNRNTYPSYGESASFDGSVVVGTTDSVEGRRAFRWTEATGLTNLGTLGTAGAGNGGFSEADGVSADGKTTVGYVTTSQDEYYKAFRWTEPTGYDVIGLPHVDQPLGIPAGGANAISGDGTVIAGQSQLNGFDNWTWTADSGFSLLNMETPENSGNVSNISYDGNVIAGGQITWNQPSPGKVIYDAVIWQKTPSGYEIHRVADLLNSAGVSTLGLHLEETTDVAADGRTIIGTAMNANGFRQAWYAVLPEPVPEPPNYLMAVVAVANCITSRRYRVRKRHKA